MKGPFKKDLPTFDPYLTPTRPSLIYLSFFQVIAESHPTFCFDLDFLDFKGIYFKVKIDFTLKKYHIA